MEDPETGEELLAVLYYPVHISFVRLTRREGDFPLVPTFAGGVERTPPILSRSRRGAHGIWRGARLRAATRKGGSRGRSAAKETIEQYTGPRPPELEYLLVKCYIREARLSSDAEFTIGKLEEALKIGIRLAEENPSVTGYESGLAEVYLYMADFNVRGSKYAKYAQALKHLHEGSEIVDRLAASDALGRLKLQAFAKFIASILWQISRRPKVDEPRLRPHSARWTRTTARERSRGGKGRTGADLGDGESSGLGLIQRQLLGFQWSTKGV